MAERGLNEVNLIGRLGADPDVRYTRDNICVVSFSLGTNQVWTDKNTNQPQSRTEWHRCVVYRRLAEVVSERLGKGDRVYVKGHLVTRKWRAQDGSDRYTTEVIVDDINFLDIKRNSKQPAQQPQEPQQSYQPPAAQGMPDNDFDDDIPF